MRSLATVVLACFVSVVSVGDGWGLAEAETAPAVVVGATSLHVRRGPGTSFPAFATIEKGQRIEVDRLEGVWAHVRLASGQEGYVHSTFLSFLGQPPPTVLRLEQPVAPEAPTPTIPRQDEEARQLELRNAQLEAELRDLRTRLKAEEAAEEGKQEGGPSVVDPQLQGDIRRLATSVEALHGYLEQKESAPSSSRDTSPQGQHAWGSPAVGLFMLMALLIGWVVGAVYGRHTERSRRSRIRF